MLEETKSFVPDQLDAIAQVSALAIPQIVAAFTQSGLERVSGLHTALDGGDWEQVSYLAHSLKGSSASVGAERLAQIAGALEAHANGEAPSMPPEVQALQADLVPEFERARAGADAFVESLGL